MPGPPPKRNRRRTNARPEWRTISAAGRVGEPPDWPIPGRQPPKAVLELWGQLWSTPQATAWEDLGWTRVVARYAKCVVAAERPGAAVALLAEVRQLEDRLGLTPMAMKRLQWEVGTPPAPEQEEPAGVTRLDEYRDLYGAG